MNQNQPSAGAMKAAEAIDREIDIVPPKHRQEVLLEMAKIIDERSGAKELAEAIGKALHNEHASNGVKGSQLDSRCTFLNRPSPRQILEEALRKYEVGHD